MDKGLSLVIINIKIACFYVFFSLYILYHKNKIMEMNNNME